MNRENAAMRVTILLCVLLLAAGVLVLPVRGGDGGGTQGTPAIHWRVVGSGGGPAAGEGVVLDGTLGQPVIGVAGNNAIALGVGYWYGAAGPAYKIYLPLVVRGLYGS